MKKITILEQEFEYKVYADANEHDGVYYWTEFYQWTEVKTHKKYFLFGEVFTKIVPKLVFEVWIDIEDSCYTKAKIRARLEEQVELLNRAKEISRGEII